MPPSGKRSRRKGGKTKSREIEVQERRRQAIELRKAGATYESIGERLGVSTTTAYNYVREALANMVAEPAEELRMMHYERLNHMLIALWPRAQKGELPAVDRAVGIMDRIARLYGIEAPQVSLNAGRQEVIVIDGSKADYIEALKTLRGGRENFNGGGPSDEPLGEGSAHDEGGLENTVEQGQMEVIDIEGVEVGIEWEGTEEE